MNCKIWKVALGCGVLFVALGLGLIIYVYWRPTPPAIPGTLVWYIYTPIPDEPLVGMKGIQLGQGTSLNILRLRTQEHSVIKYPLDRPGRWHVMPSGRPDTLIGWFEPASTGFVLHLTTGKKKALEGIKGDLKAVSLSNKVVLVASQNRLYRMTLRERDETWIVKQANPLLGWDRHSHLSMSAQGEIITIWHEKSRKVWLYQALTGKQIGAFEGTHGVISPVGRYVVYKQANHLKVFDLQTKTHSRLTEIEPYEYPLGWSFDGSRIMIRSLRTNLKYLVPELQVIELRVAQPGAPIERVVVWGWGYGSVAWVE